MDSTEGVLSEDPFRWDLINLFPKTNDPVSDLVVLIWKELFFLVCILCDKNQNVVHRDCLLIEGTISFI